jgi:hypothetical protein
MSRDYRLVVTIEDGVRSGGIGTAHSAGPACGRCRHRGRRAGSARPVPGARRADEILAGCRPHRQADRARHRVAGARTAGPASPSPVPAG